MKNVPKSAKALAVVINSNGGEPAQCHIITQKLKSFSAKNNIPIYTFAEDFATSGGFYILSIGKEFKRYLYTQQIRKTFRII